MASYVLGPGGGQGSTGMASAGGCPSSVACGAPSAHAVPAHRAKGQHQRGALPAVWHRCFCRPCFGSVHHWLPGLPWRTLCSPLPKEDLGTMGASEALCFLSVAGTEDFLEFRPCLVRRGDMTPVCAAGGSSRFVPFLDHFWRRLDAYCAAIHRSSTQEGVHVPHASPQPVWGCG